jgi:threonylcarbamoyladenosine tRNA methylthiotransferase MtaB
MSKRIAYHTLGCKLNYSETSALSRMMDNHGYTKVDFISDPADVYLINTCSVTENADKECKMLVRRIQRKSPEAIVVITGCYAQLKPQEISEIPGVDMVLGAAEKFLLPQHLNEFTKGDSTKVSSCDISDLVEFNASWSEGDRTRTFLKVQDGCDYNCSFCTIPQARGMSRSDTIDRVLQNIDHIGSQGCQEIVLTGINLGDFGTITGQKSSENFTDLVKAIDQHHTPVSRFRISSIEPNLLTDEIIHTVANSKKFMPHFHIPLQSGDNTILGKMRRRYKRELYSDLVTQIKKNIPHACIGVDVIVGFPGESDELFQNTYNFLHALDISYLHVFTYSERKNTLAENMLNKVPMNTRHERNKILRNLSFQKMQYFTQLFNGDTREVLWEKGNKNGIMEGYTDNYIRVDSIYNQELAGKIMPFTLR